MRIEELEMADFSLVKLKKLDSKLYPHCKEHGAMLKVSEHGIWRCITIHGIDRSNPRNIKKFDNLCRAGCWGVRNEIT